MKKVTLLLLVVLVMSTLFAGCGSQSASGNVISEGDKPSRDSADEEDEEDGDSNSGGWSFTDQGVHEYIDHVLKTYNKEFVFSDPEALLDDPLNDIVNVNLTNDLTVVRYKDLSEFISDAEIEEFSESMEDYFRYEGSARDFDDFYYIVQYVDDMQKGFDELWVKDSIDIKDILDDVLSSPYSDASYLSKNGVFIRATWYNPMDDYIRDYTYYEITDVNMEGDTATVYAHYIIMQGMGTINSLTFDLSDYRKIGNSVGKEWAIKNRNASFDEVVSTLGIDKSTLGEYVISIKNTSQGPVLNGFEVVEHKIYPSDLDVPDLTQVYNSPRVVVAEAGLNLRTGPGTEYDVVTLLPQYSVINGYEAFGGQEEWIFASCTLDGKEYFGWVNSEFVNYMG